MVVERSSYCPSHIVLKYLSASLIVCWKFKLEHFSSFFHLQEQLFLSRMVVQALLILLHFTDVMIFNKLEARASTSEIIMPCSYLFVFCATCFIAVVWNQTCNISEQCLYLKRLRFSWQGTCIFCLLTAVLLIRTSCISH